MSALYDDRLNRLGKLLEMKADKENVKKLDDFLLIL
jgi:hypothetical protein